MIPPLYIQISEYNPYIKNFMELLIFAYQYLFVFFKAMHPKPSI